MYIMARKSITIAEIAKLANVSKTTVSRVLNNKPDIQPETKERIKKIIEEYDYHPNVFAKAISHRKSNTIGLLIPYSANYVFSNPFYYEIIRGISLETNNNGYYVLMCYTENDNYVLALKQKRADGIIVVSPGSAHKNIFDVISNLGVPCVATSKVPGIPDMYCIDTDDVQGACLAMEHLVSLGHRRIGYINGPEILASSRERLEGYRKTLAKYNIPYDESLVKAGDTSIGSGYKAMTELLKESDITAVFVSCDLMAVGALNAINGAGMKVPDNISVVGYDDIPLAGALNPPLTTVNQFAFKKGVLAARMIIDLIEEKQVTERPKIDVELVIRSSTRQV